MIGGWHIGSAAVLEHDGSVPSASLNGGGAGRDGSSDGK